MDPSEFSERRTLIRLALLNGFIIGLALAAGMWLPALMTFLGLPVGAFTFLVIAGSALLVVAICSAAGWLSGRVQHPIANVLIWLLAALLIILVVGYRPYQLSNYFAWLANLQLWGLQVFPSSPATVFGTMLSGIFILLTLVVLALLQEYRLEGLLSEVKPGGRMTGYGWSRLLLLPLLLALPAAIVTGSIVGDGAASRMMAQMHRAIDVAATYEGDLFALALQEGTNYAALRGVQQQLGADYTIDLLQTDPETAQTIFVAHFEDGAWINCRFINEQLSFCEDASLLYTVGFAALISGQNPDCDNCLPQVDQSWTRWLAQRRAALGEDPQIAFLHQRGAHVLMRAAAADGGSAISCWFEGANPVRLRECQESAP